MPWLKREQYERLIKRAAQSDILELACGKAEARAISAEESLASERQAKDWLTLQLASRVVTKNGGYGLDHEKPTPQIVEAIPVRTKEPDEMDMARLDWYVKCYREAGHMDPETAAKDYWEAEMRGEHPLTEVEREQ